MGALDSFCAFKSRIVQKVSSFSRLRQRLAWARQPLQPTWSLLTGQRNTSTGRHVCNLHNNFALTPCARARRANIVANSTAAERVAAHSLLPTAGEDTIVAIVTQSGAGSVSILRISGSDAVSIATKLFRPGHSPNSISELTTTRQWKPRSHRISYGTLADDKERVIDEVLVLYMASPRSYTCEDVVELHCHGGPVTAQRVLSSCLQAGARLARPGEFTLRAFLNGRLDLAQAEAVHQLVSARTAAAADSALAGLSTGVGELVRSLREELLGMVAELDVRLDFDEDLEPLDQEDFLHRLGKVQAQVDEALATAERGRLMDRGVQIAIVGRPNVGKSSLLNRWTRTDRAIVTDIAGTTRDVLESPLSIGGVPATLLDTAGVRETEDTVEGIGVERARRAAREADLVVWVVSAADGVTGDDRAVLEGVVEGAKGKVVAVINKADIQPQFGAGDVPPDVRDKCEAVVMLSALTGQGIAELDDAILEAIGAPGMAGGGVGWAVNARQSEALTRASQALERVQQSVRESLPEDFWTIDLRDAVIAFGEVTGDEVTEEVLDSIFSRFCIGK